MKEIAQLGFEGLNLGGCSVDLQGQLRDLQIDLLELDHRFQLRVHCLFCLISAPTNSTTTLIRLVYSGISGAVRQLRSCQFVSSQFSAVRENQPKIKSRESKAHGGLASRLVLLDFGLSTLDCFLSTADG